MLSTFLTCQAAGYTVEVLEHHNAKGEYHKANYSEESGRVSRSIQPTRISNSSPPPSVKKKQGF